MKTKAPDRLFWMGGGVKRLLRAGLRVSAVQSRRSIVAALGQASPFTMWMATTPGATDALLHEALLLPSRRRRLGGLLAWHRPRAESIQPLGDLFEPFVWSPGELALLPIDELAEVLQDEKRAELFIGGYADVTNQALTLVRGDLRRLSVPLSMFPTCGGGGAPADSSRLAITDGGNTVRLGAYESAADAILYEADPDYRSRLLAKRRAEDTTFGACLRRLRFLRGLRQDDFGDVAAKTIARIERGETAAPHGRTLGLIAARLAVAPQEITSY